MMMRQASVSGSRYAMGMRLGEVCDPPPSMLHISTIYVTHIHHRCHHWHPLDTVLFKRSHAIGASGSKVFSHVGLQALEGEIEPRKFSKFLAIHKEFLAIQ